MNLRILALALFFGVASIPSAYASFTDIREYEVHVVESTGTTGAVASASYTIPANPYSYALAARDSIVLVDAAYESQDPATGTVTGTFTLVVDGTNYCNWAVTRSAIAGLTQEIGHSYTIKCQVADINAGSHTFAITVAGTNPVVQSFTSIGVLQNDQVTDGSLDGLIANVVNARTDLNETESHADDVQNVVHRMESKLNTTLANLNLAFARLNTTCQKTLYSMMGCEGVEILTAQNVTVDNDEVITELESSKVQLAGLSSSTTWTVLIFGALLVWALHRKWWLVATVATVGVLAVLSTQAVWASVTTILFLVVAYWLELLLENRRHRADQEESA